MKLTALRVIVLLCLLFSGSANAISIFPSDEMYIGGDALGNTNGPYSGGTWGPFVGKIDHVQSGQPNLNIESRGFYEFNIATLLNTNITSASLSFRINDPEIPTISHCFDLAGCPAISALDILGYAGNGTVELADFDAGTLVDSINFNNPLPVLGSIVAIDVTSFISELVTNNKLYAGFNFQAASFNGGLRIPNGLLTVTTASAPSSILMLGVGLFGLAVIRRNNFLRA